jgi:CRISPR-associated protein Csd1
LQRSVHHIGALKSAGHQIFFEKLVGEVRAQLAPAYPARLSIKEQGLYDGGYYHQRNELFRKKDQPKELLEINKEIETEDPGTSKSDDEASD